MPAAVGMHSYLLATAAVITPAAAFTVPVQADPDWNMFSVHCSRQTIRKYTPPTNGKGYAGHSWAYLSDGSAFIVSPESDATAFDYAFVAKLRRGDRVVVCLYDGPIHIPSRPTGLPEAPLDPLATRRMTIENLVRTPGFIYATFGVSPQNGTKSSSLSPC
jgi:hypothetical protein